MQKLKHETIKLPNFYLSKDYLIFFKVFFLKEISLLKSFPVFNFLMKLLKITHMLCEQTLLIILITGEAADQARPSQQKNVCMTIGPPVHELCVDTHRKKYKRIL